MFSDFVIIYGSVVGCLEKARDIDVAFGGKISKSDAISMAQKWAKDRGLELPIEAHRFYSTNGKVELPVPFGLGLHYKIITGEVKVRPDYRNHFSSIIRLAEKKPQEAISIIQKRLSKGSDYIGGVLIGLTEDDGVLGRGYAGDGPVALANALCHVDKEFLRQLGEMGAFLAKIKNLGSKWSQKIRPEAEKGARDHSSGNFGRYYLTIINGEVRANLAYKRTNLTLDELWKEVIGK